MPAGPARTFMPLSGAVSLRFDQPSAPQRPYSHVQTEPQSIPDRLVSAPRSARPSAAASRREEVVGSLLRALEAKDRHTFGHSVRVTRHAVRLAQVRDLPGREIEVIRRASLLHDIGKIAIPDAILGKCGRLTVEEYAEVQRHAECGAWILDPMPGLRREQRLVLHHHEWYDGRGYPAGLCGEQIPKGARIIQIADCIDAMRSPRSYRVSLNQTEVIAELKRCSGTQFDPMLIDHAIATM